MSDGEQELEIPDDAAPGPIEIELEPGDAAETPETPPAASPPGTEPPKPVKRQGNTIQTLRREKQEAEAMAQRLANELAEARRVAHQAQQETQLATAAGMENYAQRVKTESETAKIALKQAIESGNAEAIADATTRASKIAAAEADVDAWRETQKATPQPQQQPQAQPQPQQQPQPEPEPELPPTIVEYLLENDWFDPFQRGSDGRFKTNAQGQRLQNPNYQPQMHNAAMLMNQRLVWEIQNGMWPHDAAAPESIARIHEGMQAQFPEYFAEDTGAAEPPPIPTRKTPPMTAPKAPVAPAARTATPGTPARPNGTKVTLTGEERSFVDSLVANGTMRYARGHAKAGRPMEPLDAYKEYAKQKQSNPPQQQH